VIFNGPVFIEADTNGHSEQVDATSTIEGANLTYTVISGPETITIDSNGNLIIASGADVGDFFVRVSPTIDLHMLSLFHCRSQYQIQGTLKLQQYWSGL